MVANFLKIILAGAAEGAPGTLTVSLHQTENGWEARTESKIGKIENGKILMDGFYYTISKVELSQQDIMGI